MEPLYGFTKKWFSNKIQNPYLDNNNCASSFLRSLCEIGGGCFGSRYFSEGAQLPKKNAEVQNNHRRIHTKTEKRWCKVIIVINNRYLGILDIIYEEIIY